jgi:hypothetical protein
MRLSTEVTVGAPLERTWPALLELGGPLTLELGGRWEVSARLDDADEDEHAAGFHVVGHEHGGSGMAAATIRARARGDDGGATRIAFETDLRLTGAAERPDQAAAQAAADELLGRMAAHLERAASPAPEPMAEAAPVVEAAPEVGPPEPPPEVGPPEPPPEVGAPEPATSEPPPLKGSDPYPVPALKGSDPLTIGVAERALLMTAGVALGLAVGGLLWRRR